MSHDPTTEVLIEEAATDAYRLISRDGSAVRACAKKVRAGNEEYTVRVILNESLESLHQQAQAWEMVFDRLVSMGMTRDFGETVIERVLNFLDRLSERSSD